MIELYHGKQSYISFRNAQKRIVELADKFPEYNEIKIDCDSSDADKIITAYKNVDMFCSGKNILLKRLSENKQKEAILEDIKMFFETNDTLKKDVVNLILWEDGKIASNTKYFKFFNENKAVFESSDFNKRTFASWAEKEFLASGVKADRSSVYKVCQMCNFEAERFTNELEKYKLSGITNLTDKEIQELSADTLEYKIWDLIEQLNNKTAESRAKSAQILERLLSTNVDSYYILSMINWNLRQVVLAKYLHDNGTDRHTIASRLKIPPFNISTVIHTGEAYTDKQLELLYDKTNNLDYEMKIGNIEPKTGITLLLTILTN